MFSRLDNFFKTTLSHVERADTRRDAIKDEQRRKKKALPDKDGGTDAFQDDATIVSVQALLTLLENMIFENEPAVEGADKKAAEASFFEGEDRRNKKPVTPAQKAARAYGQRGYKEGSERRRRQSADQKSDTNATRPSSKVLDQSLSEDEQSHIQSLISDLKILMQKDVYQLSIHGSHDSFLDNIINAVKLARRVTRDR